MAFEGHHFVTCDGVGCSELDCISCSGTYARCSNCNGVEAYGTLAIICTHAVALLGMCKSKSHEDEEEYYETHSGLDFHE